MAPLHRCSAAFTACIWLLFCLLGPPRLASAVGAPPAVPLALRSQGVLHRLDGEQIIFELPLGCSEGDSVLDVQHRLPAGAARCSGALTLAAQGRGAISSSTWRSKQVPAIVADAAEGVAADEAWFSFRLGSAAAQRAGGWYRLQLDVYCDGSATPRLQSALFVRSACRRSDSGGDGSSDATGLTAQLWRALSGGAQQQQQQHVMRPGLLLGGSGGDARDLPSHSSRRLAQAAGGGGLVPVTLSPAADPGIVVVDGYSGVARAINSSSELPPPCGLPSTPANATCINSPGLRTAGAVVSLQMALGGGATLPENVLPADALSIAGNASLVSVTRGADGTSMLARLGVGGTDPISVAVAEGALAKYGIANAASNVITIQRDVTPPVPVITTPGAVAVTTSTQLYFSISFGEPVLAADPFALFGHNGARRMDAVLDVAAGRVDLVIYVLETGSNLDFKVWVNRGTVRDLAGNPNNQSAVLTLKYRPKSSGLQGAGIAANVGLGTSLALCASSSYLSSSLLPYAPGALACGALSLLGFAQSVFLTGRLSAQWMPETYRQVADTFGWTVGEISLPWANSYPPDMNPDYAFPFTPLVLTSTGQQVDAAQYPTVSTSSLGGTPVVAVVGDLAPLPPGAASGTNVLDDIPFLTPSEAQLVGAPPDPLRPAKPAPAPGASPAASGSQRRLFGVEGAVRRGRRTLLQAPGAGPDQPAFEGAVYTVASRGLQYMSGTGQPNLENVLVSEGAVQRAYDVMEAGGDNSAYPKQYYYDRLARTAFWASLFALVVMLAHLGCLGAMMWRQARIPSVMWFPRIELAVCLAILPALAYGPAGLFNAGAGDIALGAVLLALLPCSFLGAAFYLVWRWLQHPGLKNRRAIFVLRQDPLAEQIAAGASAPVSPQLSPRDPDAADGEDANGGADGGAGAAAAAAAAAVASPADAAARARRWSFTGLARSLCGARKVEGDWAGINLDSRFVFKYGPLFEATYGQTMARRRATYEFDPLRGKVDRGALVPLPELATLSCRGKPLVEPHHLRTPAQLLSITKLVLLAAATSGVAALDSYIQCCLLILLYGFHAIYLLAVRPYNSALVGGFEVATTVCTLCVTGLAMAVMDGRGDSDALRSIIGTVMLVVQLIGFVALVTATLWVSLRALWGALGLRRRLRLKPSPSDRFAEVVQQVMARDPEILARKFLDRWMVRALGVGLYDRPVWRRETEDLRRLLRATTLPKRRVGHLGSVVRSKGVTPSEPPKPTPTPPPPALVGDQALPPPEPAADPRYAGSAPGSSSGEGSADGSHGSQENPFAAEPAQQGQQHVEQHEEQLSDEAGPGEQQEQEQEQKQQQQQEQEQEQKQQQQQQGSE